MWRALDSCFSAISRRNSPDASGLLLGVGPAREAKHDQGFDGPARVTEVSVNLKLGVQGVGLNLCKSSLGAAYWARVSWLEHERRILKTHVLSLHAAASSVRFEDVFRKVELKASRFALSSRFSEVN